MKRQQRKHLLAAHKEIHGKGEEVIETQPRRLIPKEKSPPQTAAKTPTPPQTAQQQETAAEDAEKPQSADRTSPVAASPIDVPSSPVRSTSGSPAPQTQVEVSNGLVIIKFGIY